MADTASGLGGADAAVCRLRRAIDGAASKIGYTVLAIVTGGVLVVIWAGIKVYVLRQ
ncbi:hypothetical protein LGR54_24690 [Ancylobacter sp. Lp-2]|uniref:hypothetical protein n=1 Tax=Ancylobacter sp. Lp-2 TaxID=2881339 RepID=UPI001E3BB823|nr:hypothetical protein [Ancylobacter sp. Lp-2]MCB4771814.1 hypothetical protein [Ancylobacter sp. Lp-2]